MFAMHEIQELVENFRSLNIKYWFLKRYNERNFVIFALMYIRGEQYTGKNNLRREDDKCFIKFSKIVRKSRRPGKSYARTARNAGLAYYSFCFYFY